MGCDIHMVLERRVGEYWLGLNSFESFTKLPHKEGDWHFCCPPARDRNYERFAKLAGVRGDGPEPRGLPRDASALTRHEGDGWGIDGHSHSWLALADAVKVFVETQWWPPFMDTERSERKYPESFFFGVEEDVDGPLSDYRLVFWFDN